MCGSSWRKKRWWGLWMVNEHLYWYHDDNGDFQEVPCWLWEDVDEDSYFMPVNTLKFTEERVVKRVYVIIMMTIMVTIMMTIWWQLWWQYDDNYDENDNDYNGHHAQVHRGEHCEEGVLLSWVLIMSMVTTMVTTLMKKVMTILTTRYLLGRIISALLSEANIHYWTSGGSTLGIVRLTFLLCRLLIYNVSTNIFRNDNMMFIQARWPYSMGRWPRHLRQRAGWSKVWLMLKRKPIHPSIHPSHQEHYDDQDEAQLKEQH